MKPLSPTPQEDEELRALVRKQLLIEGTPTDVYALEIDDNADDDEEWCGFNIDALENIVVKLIKARDEQREHPSVHIFDTWLSIDMGAEIRFEPKGMWMQRVWQNGATYVCSGKKKYEECESITDSYDYRFTRIGSGSVGKEYNDVFITGKDIKRWFDEGAEGDLKNLAGWFTLTQPPKGGE